MLHFPEQFFGIHKPDIFFFSDEEPEPKERESQDRQIIVETNQDGGPHGCQEVTIC